MLLIVPSCGLRRGLFFPLTEIVIFELYSNLKDYYLNIQFKFSFSAIWTALTSTTHPTPNHFLPHIYAIHVAQTFQGARNMEIRKYRRVTSLWYVLDADIFEIRYNSKSIDLWFDWRWQQSFGDWSADLYGPITRGRDNVLVVKVDNIDGGPVSDEDSAETDVRGRGHVPHGDGAILRAGDHQPVTESQVEHGLVVMNQSVQNLPRVHIPNSG